MDANQLKSLAAALLPLIKEGIDVAAPAAAPVANVVIDGVEALVMDANGTATPANAVAAPTDAASRLTALEQHVAALVIAQNGAAAAQHSGALNLVRANAAAASLVKAATATAASS